MKITRRQLRRLIEQTIKSEGYGESLGKTDEIVNVTFDPKKGITTFTAPGDKSISPIIEVNIDFINDGTYDYDTDDILDPNILVRSSGNFRSMDMQKDTGEMHSAKITKDGSGKPQIGFTSTTDYGGNDMSFRIKAGYGGQKFKVGLSPKVYDQGTPGLFNWRSQG